VISVPRNHVDHPARVNAPDHPNCLELTPDGYQFRASAPGTRAHGSLF
jgi:hypothetical protein